jgi:hypothetical protein
MASSYKIVFHKAEMGYFKRRSLAVPLLGAHPRVNQPTDRQYGH